MYAANAAEPRACEVLGGPSELPRSELVHMLSRAERGMSAAVKRGDFEEAARLQKQGACLTAALEQETARLRGKHKALPEASAISRNATAAWALHVGRLHKEWAGRLNGTTSAVARIINEAASRGAQTVKIYTTKMALQLPRHDSTRPTVGTLLAAPARRGETHFILNFHLLYSNA